MSTIAGNHNEYDQPVQREDESLLALLAARKERRKQIDSKLHAFLPSTVEAISEPKSLSAVRAAVRSLSELATHSTHRELAVCCAAVAKLMAEQPASRLSPRLSSAVNGGLAILLAECRRVLAGETEPSADLLAFISEYWRREGMPATWDAEA